MDWWIANLLRDEPALLVSWIVWVIGSTVLHELAHGWAAIWQGDDTPRATGHMTWNPLVHMGGWSLLMFAIVGICWGAMPVNPSRFRSRYGDAFVSLAGPAMNLALAAASIILGSIWSGYCQGVDNPLWRNFMVFFIAGAFLNVSLAIFNLIPVPPLDGSRILAGILPSYRRFIQQDNVAMIGMIVLIVLLTQGGGFVFDAGRAIARTGFESVTSILPGAKGYSGAMKESEALHEFLNSPEYKQAVEELRAAEGQASPTSTPSDR